jgi:hypothetical protein
MAKKLSETEIHEKLAQLDQLRDELLGQAAELTSEERIRALEAAQIKVEPGTPEMEALLSTGYKGMTVEKAQLIIEERKKDPHTWPLERVEQAEAFLAAYNATKKERRPSSDRRGWKRTRAIA